MHPTGNPGWNCACGAQNRAAAGDCHRCSAPRPPTPPPPLPARAAPRRSWVTGYGLTSGTAFLLAIIIYVLFLAPRRGNPSVQLPVHSGSPSAQLMPTSAATPAPGPWYNAGQPPTGPPPGIPQREWAAMPAPVAGAPIVWMPPVRLATPAPPPVIYRAPRPESAWTSSRDLPQPTYSTPDEIVARVKGSVVLVLARRGRSLRHGAGFPLGPRHLLTCAHLLDEASEVLLVTPDGRQLRVAGGATDPHNDLALLVTDGDLPPALTLAGDGVSVGEQIAVTGYPFVGEFLNSGRGLHTDSVPGVVSARVNRVSPSNFAVDSLRIDAEVRPGYSGGPVYSIRGGAVLGMLSFRVADDRVEGYAAPAGAIRALLARL